MDVPRPVLVAALTLAACSVALGGCGTAHSSAPSGTSAISQSSTTTAGSTGSAGAAGSLTGYCHAVGAAAAVFPPQGGSLAQLKVFQHALASVVPLSPPAQRPFWQAEYTVVEGSAADVAPSQSELDAVFTGLPGVIREAKADCGVDLSSWNP